MLKNPDSYPRGRNGIHTKCRVIVVCDKCGGERSTQFSNYKRKKAEFDFCQSCKNSQGICGMLHKKHSDETKKKFSDDRVGVKNGFYGKRHSKAQKQKWIKQRRGKLYRGPIEEKERKDISKRMKKYWSGMTPEEKATRLENYDYSKMIKGLLFNGGKYSALHRQVKNCMLVLGLTGFISEEQINKYVVDEINYDKGIVIEVNGDYWHANPNEYRPDDIISYPKGTRMASEVWEKDNIKINALKEKYLVFVVWEFDIRRGRHIDTLTRIKNEHFKSCG